MKRYSLSVTPLLLIGARNYEYFGPGNSDCVV